MCGAGQGLVAGVDPGLSGLDGAGNQEDRVLSGVVLPEKGGALVKRHHIWLFSSLDSVECLCRKVPETRSMCCD